eukprot:12392694-Alexandrium_andersonii.AAC.1
MPSVTKLHREILTKGPNGPLQALESATKSWRPPNAAPSPAGAVPRGAPTAEHRRPRARK